MSRAAVESRTGDARCDRPDSAAGGVVWLLLLSLAATCSAAVAAVSAFALGSGLLPVLAVMVAAAAAWGDLRSRRVPNGLTYPAVLLGLFAQALASGASHLGLDWALPWLGATGWRDGLAGCAIIGGAAVLIWMVGGMGGGDAKLLGAVGAMLGLEWGGVAAINALCFASAIALANYMTRGGLVDRLRLLSLAVASRRLGGGGAAALGFERTEIPLAVPILLGVLTWPWWSCMASLDAMLSWMQS